MWDPASLDKLLLMNNLELKEQTVRSRQQEMSLINRVRLEDRLR